MMVLYEVGLCVCRSSSLESDTGAMGGQGKTQQPGGSQSWNQVKVSGSVTH